MTSHFNTITTSYERLINIDWSQDITHLRSNVALMREYLRRTAQWAKILNCTAEWPFVDFSAYLEVKTLPPDKMAQGLRDMFEHAVLNEQFQELCKCILNWTVQDAEELEAIANLPDPYEPLLRFFERGGYFYRQHGFIYVEQVGIPALGKGWEHYYEIDAIKGLDDRTLNQMD